MRQIASILVLIVFQTMFLTAQTWDSIGGGVKVNDSSGKVGALCLYNGNLIAGGTFNIVGNNIGSNNIAQWNGAVWSSIQTGPEGVNSLIEYNGTLIAGTGEHSFISSTIPGKYGDIIGQWNGVFWDTIGSGINGILPPPTMNSLCDYFGNLYAGGYFNGTTAHIVYNSVVTWNGIEWDTLPKQDTIGEVNSMAVYNSILYVGGILFLNRSNDIAGWNGTAWSALGKGVNREIFALAVSNGKLYAGGAFDSAGGMPANHIAVWDGFSWQPLGSGVSNVIYSLAPYGSVLIAGGTFDTAGGIVCNKIAQWDGTSWASLGSGVASTVKNVYEGVYALLNDSGTLYVGGEFDSTGGIHANNIAQWRSPLGINKIQNNANSILVYPNPSIGLFTLALSNINEKCNVEIYNMLGEKIYKAKINSNNTQIILSGQSTGVYFYRVLKETGGLVGEGKIMIAR